MAENKELVIDVAPETVVKQIGVNITKLREERSKAEKKLEKGQRLRRTPFECLEDKGIMNAQALYDEHLKIEKRESTLSSSERELIQRIALVSMQECFAEAIEKAQAAGQLDNPGIPKKKRTKKTK